MGANLAGAGQYAEARLDGLPGDNGKQTGILQYPERRARAVSQTYHARRGVEVAAENSKKVGRREATARRNK